MLYHKEVIEKAMAFPMDKVMYRYQQEQALSLEQARRHERELKRFLALVSLNDKGYGLSGLIDTLWHTFILFTKLYARFCQEVAGRFIHHEPNVIGFGPREEHAVNSGSDSYATFLNDYQEVFNEVPSAHVWPQPARRQFDHVTAEASRDVAGTEMADEECRGIADDTQPIDEECRGIADGTEMADEECRGIADDTQSIDEECRGIVAGTGRADEECRGIADGTEPVDEECRGLVDEECRGIAADTQPVDEECRGIADGTEPVDEECRGIAADTQPIDEECRGIAAGGETTDDESRGVAERAVR